MCVIKLKNISFLTLGQPSVCNFHRNIFKNKACFNYKCVIFVSQLSSYTYNIGWLICYNYYNWKKIF